MNFVCFLNNCAKSFEKVSKMFKIFFYSDLNTTQALEQIREKFPPGGDRDEIIRFIETSKRGVVKKAAEPWENE